MRWEGVPHERVRLAICATATASGLIAAVLVRGALREARLGARVIQLALAAVLAAIGLLGVRVLLL